ncbi:hypothetical protein [Jannaschia sp. LMIT008]|uniref:hypothetical protein n=1 Tax=Jannaschia maritima TaxID=3032585 RepID=UPI002811ED62|nr:hypothetical protein [Jannaschia sp. LMIT008]
MADLTISKLYMLIKEQKATNPLLHNLQQLAFMQLSDGQKREFEKQQLANLQSSRGVR